MNEYQEMRHVKNRINSLDALKCFAIYLVIWGHCILWFGEKNCEYNSVYRGIYSFHTSLFMMISGFFSYSSMKLPLSAFILKKAKNLLFPCFLWGGFLWIVYETLYSFQYGHNYISLGALMSDFYWLSDFWFLKSCFICYLIAYLGNNSNLNKVYWVIGTLIISQIIVVNFVSFMYPCFLIGLEIRQNELLFKRVLSNSFVLCVMFAIFLLFWSPNVWHYSHGIPPDILDKNLHTWLAILFSRFYRLVIGIIGSLAAFSFFIVVFENEPKSKVVSSVFKTGKYTLEIYILQAIIVEKILCRFIHLDYLNQYCYTLIVTPLLAIVIYTICMLLVKISYTNRYVSSFLWKKSME